MKIPPPIEDFARQIDPQVSQSVRRATSHQTKGRLTTLPLLFCNPDEARSRAAKIKDSVLDSLQTFLLQFENQALQRGMHVHWAQDADSAVSKIASIIQSNTSPGCTIVKAKSMMTEEIHLNDHLLTLGYDVVETDLGEFIVQLDGDSPSHIVAPIIHKNRLQISESFVKNGLGPRTTEPSELTAQARMHLREKFRVAEVGISGVNFAIARTGKIVLVENEGNNRFCTTAPRIHIAVMGIEKLLPSESDLPLFLHLLAASATGQKLPVYVHLISGPRSGSQPDGPEQVHIVLVDNGRTRVIDSKYRSILRCLRCGACQNVCPVFREASGHAYHNVYGGPIGAVLAPAMFGISNFGDLAKASTLCGACREACPVDIPIPELLLELRDDAFRTGIARDELPWKWFGVGAKDALAWKIGLTALPIASRVSLGPLAEWSAKRTTPNRVGRNFRKWWRERS